MSRHRGSCSGMSARSRWNAPPSAASAPPPPVRVDVGALGALLVQARELATHIPARLRDRLRVYLRDIENTISAGTDTDAQHAHLACMISAARTLCAAHPRNIVVAGLSTLLGRCVTEEKE